MVGGGGVGVGCYKLELDHSRWGWAVTNWSSTLLVNSKFFELLCGVKLGRSPRGPAKYKKRFFKGANRK